MTSVAIIGRANVGKSTLFNCLAKKRRAMVSDEPGTTRDLRYTKVAWNGKKFELVDTGGFLASQKNSLKSLTKKEQKRLRADAETDIDRQVEERARQALEKAENVIAQGPGYSCLYARDIIGGKFEEGEKAIAQSSKWSYRYAKSIIGGRFEEGEDAIAQDPGYSYYYAMDVLKGRFEKGEDTIAQSPQWSKWYAEKFGLKEEL